MVLALSVAGSRTAQWLTKANRRPWPPCPDQTKGKPAGARQRTPRPAEGGECGSLPRLSPLPAHDSWQPNGRRCAYFRETKTGLLSTRAEQKAGSRNQGHLPAQPPVRASHGQRRADTTRVKERTSCRSRTPRGRLDEQLGLDTGENFLRTWETLPRWRVRETRRP